MKIKRSYLKLMALASGIGMAIIVALLMTSNATAVNQDDYSSLKNGLELQSEVLAFNSPETNSKCGDGEGEKKCGEAKSADEEKKCGEGNGDAVEKSTKGEAKASDEEKKCGEGKCGSGDAEESSDEGASETE